MKSDSGPERLKNTLAEHCDGLVFVSEIDAPIEPVVFPEIQSLAQSDLAEGLDLGKNEPIETTDAHVFFDRLTRHKEWHGPIEKENTKRFTRLRKTLESELDDLHVFRIGKVKIDIYVLGISKIGIIAGVHTSAVET